MSTELPPSLRLAAEEAFRLAASLATAEDAQWMPSHSPKPREDTTERSKGEHSDPTGSTVIDSRRLALRASVMAGEDALTKTADYLAYVRRGLERALSR
ncbi:hypothetical protein ACFSBZ_06770 [Amnibacterium flavum]|uniref:Uncharacterized protein n=1 Tax=Amnibacterium flavum TaxID=2173173 RepID=A0A2V1HML4_9MICO|nr:hypothetical protein [Amnibacterium flavum]PVZ93853.1 hypothetical protein DDQ50_08710 [Amnibacterium flavum]